MQSFHGVSKRGRQLTDDEIAYLAANLRRLEKKVFKEAVRALRATAIPLPCSQNLKQYQKDRNEKQRLQRASGVKQTVNPLELRQKL